MPDHAGQAASFEHRFEQAKHHVELALNHGRELAREHFPNPSEDIIVRIADMLITEIDRIAAAPNRPENK